MTSKAQVQLPCVPADTADEFVAGVKKLIVGCRVCGQRMAPSWPDPKDFRVFTFTCPCGHRIRVRADVTGFVPWAAFAE